MQFLYKVKRNIDISMFRFVIYFSKIITKLFAYMNIIY